MNATRKLGLLAVAMGALGAADGAPGVAAQAKLWVAGTSTVQPYKCVAKAVDARVAGLPDSGPFTLATLATASGGSARIDVAALDCANDTMNEHLRNALRAKDHPRISFEVKGYQLGAAQGGRAKLSLDGTLTIAGATRPVRLEATATELAGGTVAIAGQHAFDMTAYGVKPPELFFGAMKVDPKITIGFELKLAAPAPGPVAAGGR